MKTEDKKTEQNETAAERVKELDELTQELSLSLLEEHAAHCRTRSKNRKDWFAVAFIMMVVGLAA